jgi:hypothetical protein
MNKAIVSPRAIKGSRRGHALAAVAFAALLSACATTPSVVVVPETLKPASGETLAVVAAAKGVQIYECRLAKDPAAGAQWVFVAPEAELFSAQGKKIGHHGAGPAWEANDGSRIVASVKQRADAPQADAIPWLLLAARDTGPQGAFSGVTSVQRVNTVGGIAPRDGCTTATTGKAARVDYSADYYFYRPQH